MLLVSSCEKSNSLPLKGSPTSMPSISTNVWLASAPRIRTWVSPPKPPVRLTATPGTSRSTSATKRLCLFSNSSPVITVTALPTAEDGKGTRLAETTTSGTLGTLPCRPPSWKPLS